MKRKTIQNKKHNYIALVVIYIVVIAVVLYLASWYNTYKNYQEEIPVLQDVVSEINPDEVTHYLTENPSPVLYLCSASDSDCREFEKSIKNNLKSNNYEDLVYVNLEDIDDKTSYVNELLKDTDFTIDRTPCLIKFTDGKITAVEDGLNGAVLTRDETLNFLDVNLETGQ